jgi:hypothetical protein
MAAPHQGFHALRLDILATEMTRRNLHRLAEERSLALHRAIAELLPARPSILDDARRRVAGWLETGEIHPHYARAWWEILGGSVESVTAVLLDESEQGRALRQATPFSGVIDPRTRWRIWREVRERTENP